MTSGNAIVGYQVTCTDCGVRVTANTHILIRTSQYLPFEEAWAWGNMSIVGTLDFMARAYAQYEYEHTWPILTRACTPPLCIGTNIAGVEINLGISVGVSAYFGINFDAQVVLTYDRMLTVNGTASGHAIRTSGFNYDFSKEIDGFNPIMTCAPPPLPPSHQPNSALRAATAALG